MTTVLIRGERCEITVTREPTETEGGLGYDERGRMVPFSREEIVREDGDAWRESLRVPQTPTSGVNAIFGTMPDAPGETAAEAYNRGWDDCYAAIDTQSAAYQLGRRDGLAVGAHRDALIADVLRAVDAYHADLTRHTEARLDHVMARWRAAGRPGMDGGER
jgi:hypothetical protein